MTATDAPVTSPELLIEGPEGISSEWLTSVLGRGDLEITSTDAIGTGQMSRSYRVGFDGPDGADTVVVKVASDDPDSRATGVGMHAYYREIAFYTNLANRIGGPVARCHAAIFQPKDGFFTLVLEDVVGAEQGDQIAGCSVEHARIAMTELAKIHGPVLGDLALGLADWLNKPEPLDQALLTSVWPGFLERYSDRVADEHLAVCEHFIKRSDAWSADRRPPLGLVHGDYRLDNLLFGAETFKVVDWQTVQWGPGMTDAAYFIGGGLSIEDRRAHEEDIVRDYHAGLLDQGVKGLSWEHCWEEYRRATYRGIVMVVAASMVVGRTERGDEMFMAWIARNAQQIIDLEAESLLPESAAKPPVLRPDPDADGLHQPGPEDIWNESWYLDAISDDGSLGMYVRLGRIPNQDHSVFMASIVGPDRPSIMLVDHRAPLPSADDPTQVIDIDGLHYEHHVEEPLTKFRVVTSGTAESHADASAPLREEVGEPVEIHFDLTWDTAGIPYAWRQTSRYEIPCRVSGTIRIGDEEIGFSGPGQRDHSWGARDWYATDWMWSAFHFEDGTETHAVGVPAMPDFGVGYVQGDGEISEIESLAMKPVPTENGLTESDELVMQPQGLTIGVEPLAFGVVRFESDDGRVSHFPRSMCRVTADDGRSGLGWIEWNRNQA
jgi:hypothetical protein